METYLKLSRMGNPRMNFGMQAPELVSGKKMKFVVTVFIGMGARIIVPSTK
jgi:hypothetical protein